MTMPQPAAHALDLNNASWHKSSHSGGANDCVELAELGPYVAIRDSKEPHGAALIFDRSAVAAFVGAAASGHL